MICDIFINEFQKVYSKYTEPTDKNGSVANKMDMLQRFQ